MRTGQQHHPEALLAGMDTALAELVILALAVLAQEERPFQTPFLALTHKSPNFGGLLLRGGLVRFFRGPRSRFAFTCRSRIEGFFFCVVLCASAQAFSSSSPRRPLLMPPVDHAVIILKGHLRHTQRFFRFHGNVYDLPVNTGEQLRPLASLSVLLDYVRRLEHKALLP